MLSGLKSFLKSAVQTGSSPYLIIVICILDNSSLLKTHIINKNVISCSEIVIKLSMLVENSETKKKSNTIMDHKPLCLSNPHIPYTF